MPVTRKAEKTVPIYEYECPKCGVFEVEQRIVEDPLQTCPTHPKESVTKLISRSVFALKGGGWYSQGYGSGAKSSGGDSAGSSEKPAPAAPCASGACAAAGTGTCPGDSN